MSSPEIIQLLDRFLANELTSKELIRFRELVLSGKNDKVIEDAIEVVLKQSNHKSDSLIDEDIVFERITSIAKHRMVAHRVHFLKTAWFRYAAAVVLVIGIGAYIFTSKQSRIEKTVVAGELNKEPGQDKAILTLSDGRQIVLDNSTDENISDGSISIKKSDGIVKYNAALTSETNLVSYNSMSTPCGGQYQLVLPDGSQVWLNSASSIKYPTIFQGNNRIVELSGEAYFDIKENRNVPFIVKTHRAEVLVLGTAFNVNSYKDEPQFSTTLVNGSVKIVAGNESKTIKPGQQAQFSNSHPNILKVNNDVDINQVIAWQKGIFEFDGVSLDIIARQLSRWYDVKVTVEKESINFPLSGGITKKTSLQNVLKVLKAAGVKNKWENNIVTLYTK
jgi:transmembrane sensor